MKKRVISKLVIAIFFIILVYIFKKIGIDEIIKTISKANPVWILISFLSIFLMFLFWSFRLKFLLKTKTKITKIYMLNLLGSFMNTVTPTAGAGGEPVKAYYVSKIENKPYLDSLVIVLLDKIIFNNVFFTSAIFTSLLYIFIAIKIPVEIKTLALVILFVIVFMSVLGLVVKNKWATVKKPLTQILIKIHTLNFIKKRFKSFKTFKNYIKKSVADLFISIKLTFSDKKIFSIALTYTILSWFFFYFSFYAIFLAIGAEINLWHLFVIVTISKLIGDITFIPGGIGITESTLLALFILFPINPVAAATVTIIQRGLSYLYALVLGYISFSYFEIKNDKLKELPKPPL